MEAVVVEKSFAGGLLRVVLKLADGTEVIANRHGIDAGVQPGQKSPVILMLRMRFWLIFRLRQKAGRQYEET